MADKHNVVRSEVIEFPEGTITVYDNGTARFFFRSVDYVYKRGSDITDGMEAVVSAASADAIKTYFKRQC